MKKNLFLLALIVSCSLLLISFAKANNSSRTIAPVKDSIDSITVADEATLSDKLFNELHLQDAGLSKETVEYAIKGYQKLVDSGLVNNDRYLTIVDLSQSSRNKRFYILDMANDSL